MSGQGKKAVILVIIFTTFAVVTVSLVYPFALPLKWVAPIGTAVFLVVSRTLLFLAERADRRVPVRKV